MIHNSSIDSHIFVFDLNATTEMEEERETHDMCAVCSLSSLHRHHHHYDDDQIMRMISIDDDDQLNDDIINKKEEEEVTNMIAVLISSGDLFIDMIIAD